MNKLKSRSLDIKNKPGLLASALAKNVLTMPKSVSDDQLVQGTAASNLPGAGSLHGLSEYEAPWDTSRHPSGFTGGPQVSHSRSRSYELNFKPLSFPVLHGKSQSCDKTKSDQLSHNESNYERPWDQNDVLPQGHCKYFLLKSVRHNGIIICT